MTDREKIGEAGTASRTNGVHELKPEHMARTNGVIPPKSVPPPDAERNRPPKGPKERP